MNETTTTLADGFLSTFFVRKDSYPLHLGNRYEPQKGHEITAAVLERHLKGEIVVGSYSTDPTTNSCIWCCSDFDCHEEEGDTDADAAQKWRTATDDAFALVAKLQDQGIVAVTEHSGGGIHVWVFFDGPVPAADLVAWNPGPPTDEVEFFPKQGRVNGKFGNLVRVPGRHPKRKGVWSLARNGDAWLPWDESQEIFADPPTNDPSLVPALPGSVDGGVAQGSQEAHSDPLGLEPLKDGISNPELDKERLRGFLEELPVRHLTDYDDWFRVGCIIKRYLPGMKGLALWDEFSQKAPNYDETACLAKWPTIDAERPGGPGLGTLVEWGKSVPSIAAKVLKEAVDAGIGNVGLGSVNSVLTGRDILRVIKVGTETGMTTYDAVFRGDDGGRRMNLGAFRSFRSFERWEAAYCDTFSSLLVMAGETEKARGANWKAAFKVIVACLELEDTDETNRTVMMGILQRYMEDTAREERSWDTVRLKEPHRHKGDLFVNSVRLAEFLQSQGVKLPAGMTVSQSLVRLGATRKLVGYRDPEKDPAATSARYWRISLTEIEDPGS